MKPIPCDHWSPRQGHGLCAVLAQPVSRTFCLRQCPKRTSLPRAGDCRGEHPDVIAEMEKRFQAVVTSLTVRQTDRASVPKATRGETDDVATAQKIRQFLDHFRQFLREGAVREETAILRHMLCAGEPGIHPPCEHNKTKHDNPALHYCAGCGCGDRALATLYEDGAPLGKHPRLWMPNSNCPKQHHRVMAGTGPESLERFGGAKELKRRLRRAALEEVKRLGVSFDRWKTLVASGIKFVEGERG